MNYDYGLQFKRWPSRSTAQKSRALFCFINEPCETSLTASVRPSDLSQSINWPHLVVLVAVLASPYSLVIIETLSGRLEAHHHRRAHNFDRPQTSPVLWASLHLKLVRRTGDLPMRPLQKARLSVQLDGRLDHLARSIAAQLIVEVLVHNRQVALARLVGLLIVRVLLVRRHVWFVSFLGRLAA